MLQLGTIGTSWITEQLIEGAVRTRRYQLRGVYSRSKEKGKLLAEKYNATYYCDSLNELLFDELIDVIYIASPNHVHFEQIIKALKAGKDVICEKPLVLNYKQWQEVHSLAKKEKLYVFEGVMHVHSRNYLRLKQFVYTKLKELDQPFIGANFNLGQYSSRYNEYLDSLKQNTTPPGIFTLEAGGGTLMDLGVYPIYVMLDLFGDPSTVRYHTTKGANGIDLAGHIIFQYKNYQVTAFISKAVHSTEASQIYLGEETILIEDITRIKSVELINKEGEKATICDYRPMNPMIDELNDFADVLENKNDTIQNNRYKEWTKRSEQVIKIMDKLRQSAGIIFPKEDE